MLTKITTMIEAVGLKEEEDSPFFIENKRICEFWDQIITKKSGSVHGKYTAWALHLTGNFKTDYNCRIQLKKSTSTSTGNLFISDDKLVYKQTLFTLSNLNLQSLFNSKKYELYSNSKYLLLRTPINEHLKSLIKDLKKTNPR